jgi:hypothetical protein
MSGVVVVLWLGTAASRPTADPELDSWARARVVRIEDARAAPAATAEYAEGLVRKIEELLEGARVKSDAMDEAGALARLTEASQLIEGHPELPQAAWLSAERMTLEATLFERRPDSAEKARALRRAARALEGKRVAPLAEAGKLATDEGGPAEAIARVAIQGLEPDDRLFWDGRPAPHAVPAGAEPHHARVVRQGRTVWAGWTAANAGTRLTLGAPTPVTCSLDDLGAASIKDQRVIAPAGARCPSWAVARPQAGGGIEIASCAKSRCGPLLPWHKGNGGEFAGPPQPAPERPTPVWLFVAAGIGAAALTSVVVWQSGVFDEPNPARDRVLFNGPARR